MLGVKLHKWKVMSTKAPIYTYNKPAHVYIPLISGNDTNITVLVKKGDYVYKGSIIARRKGNYRIPIHASISGVVKGFEEKYYLNGQKIRCVVIENDYKEKYEVNKGVKRNLTKYTKQEFIELLKECGVVGLGGSGFPTYIKYNNPRKIETLIINAVESEPYITSDYAIIKEKCEEILEAIDATLEINHIPEAIIAVKKTNTEIIRIFNNFIGTYLKIKLVLVPDSYTMGYEKGLIEYVKKISYPNHPNAIGIVVNNVSTIYSIYQALKYQQPITERIVTFTGDALKKPQNVRVKYGTLTSEVVEQIGGYKRNKTIQLVAGGPMMGTGMVTDDFVITSNLTCVLALKAKSKEIVSEACIHCGKCVEYCPAKLSPVLIMENKNRPNYLKQLEPNRCIGCGLCSYMCPARIKVREFVREAKEGGKR